MNNFRKSKFVPTHYLIFIVAMLCIPALLINLGLFAFTGDEAIRSLVALEMKLSGNYIATTMHGTDYINKPPLFNWLILLVSELYGVFGEWPARLTTLCGLIAFVYIQFRVLKKYFNLEFAALGAFMLITSGRILFYDSMLGLIDITFSAVIYLMFMSVYFFGEKQQWNKMFVISYSLMATGFLLKAFPAIVFQGLTLLAATIFFKRWKLLFSLPHLKGIMIALIILGIYFIVLHPYRSLDVYINNLLTESTKRTVMAYDWERFFVHLFKFPLDSLYHFLPWSLLLIFFFRSNLLSELKKNPFVYFNFIVLVVNLPVYWSSVQVMARYLLMFIPLFNTVGLYFLLSDKESNHFRYRSFYTIWGILLILITLSTSIIPFIEKVNYLPGTNLISPGLFICLALCSFLYFTFKKQAIWWFISALLIVKIGFNLIIIPVRNDESIVTVARQDVSIMAAKYSDRKWFVFGDGYIREPASFYLTQKTNYIVHRTNNLNGPDAIYLIAEEDLKNFNGVILDSLQTDYPEVKHYVGITK